MPIRKFIETKTSEFIGSMFTGVSVEFTGQFHNQPKMIVRDDSTMRELAAFTFSWQPGESDVFVGRGNCINGLEDAHNRSAGRAVDRIMSLLMKSDMMKPFRKTRSQNEAEQAGAGYPPQGVGSPDP